MPRNAVKMTEDQFKELLLTWADQVRAAAEKLEGHPPETQEERNKRLAEEARDRTRYGEMHAWDMKIHDALMACVTLENVIFKDLSKVNFDWENCGCEPGSANNPDPCGFWTTSEGVPTLGCYAGGDWEDSVYFVLYPESATKIRAYMPKAGNTWNLKTKTAWGSGDEEDEDPDTNPRKVDVGAFRADVESRIKATYSHALVVMQSSPDGDGYPGIPIAVIPIWRQ